MAFLYPELMDPGIIDKYIIELDELAEILAGRGINLIAVKTPLPDCVLTKLSVEDEFNSKVRNVLDAHGFELHDYTTVANDDSFFYDTDHVNKDGVINFMDAYLGALLQDNSTPAQ